MYIMDRWISKTAVVTGASGGIGAAIAVALADVGLNVVAAARRLEKLQEIQKQVKGRGRIICYKCDVGKEDEVTELMEFAIKETGGIDILINNAALLYKGTLTDFNGDGVTLSEIDECIRVNLMSVIVATRLAARDMVQRKSPGHVIVINSINGHKIINVGQVQSTSVYPATKYALRALSELLRFEFNYASVPIRLTSISPGAVDTPMISLVPYMPASAPKLKSEDVANAVLYAISLPQHVNVTELIIQATGELV